jgi:hypothetical protein
LEEKIKHFLAPQIVQIVACQINNISPFSLSSSQQIGVKESKRKKRSVEYAIISSQPFMNLIPNSAFRRTFTKDMLPCVPELLDSKDNKLPLKSL